MPLGFERLNERTQRPNAFINFIKPLKASSLEDQKIAQDFLERIAAQCYPVMKRDHISVMALEEYEPNREFLGRNFNAGEVIQLVLKDKAGRWLSFRFVQMVMMHELAHCKQMNHSKYFWQVRNQYANHMKELWAKKYAGEGVWGRGQNLNTGGFVYDRMPESPDIPEHLCGGAYRRARKRKRGKSHAGALNLTYAERQQKRIARKFGVHGEGHDLGEDELVRGALEQGKRRPGKPRVANSKRGRELRASAALARFDAEKNDKQQQRMHEKSLKSIDSDTDSEDGSDDPDTDMGAFAKITDQRGRDLYQVCGDEGEQHEGGQEEVDELRRLGMKDFGPPPGSNKDALSKCKRTETVKEQEEDSETESDPEITGRMFVRNGNLPNPGLNEESKKSNEMEGKTPSIPAQDATIEAAIATQSSAPQPTIAVLNSALSRNQERSSTSTASSTNVPTTPAAVKNSAVCPICTMENDKDSPTCAACANVIKPKLMPNHWRCKSEICQRSSYINAGDVGRCGLCGQSKPIRSEVQSMGVLSADVLRWD